MNSGHGPADDFEFIMNDFCDGREAIRRARSVRDDVMFSRIVLVMVNSQHDGEVFIFGGRGDDDLLHRAAHMFLGVRGIGKSSGRLNHHLGAHRFPRQLGRIFFRKHANVFFTYFDGVLPGCDLVWQIAKNRVVFEQMCEGFWVGKIVDRNELKIGIVERGAQYVAADASKTIDSYSDSHVASERVMETWRKNCGNVDRKKMVTGGLSTRQLRWVLNGGR